VVSVFRVECFFFFSIDDLTLNNVALILGADMDIDMSIETYM
jgi:hypothetical protein